MCNCQNKITRITIITNVGRIFIKKKKTKLPAFLEIYVNFSQNYPLFSPFIEKYDAYFHLIDLPAAAPVAELSADHGNLTASQQRHLTSTSIMTLEVKRKSFTILH